MSRVTVGQSTPSGTQSVNSSGDININEFVLNYSEIKPPTNFKGPNVIPPVHISMRIQKGNVFPRLSGQIAFTFFDGFRLLQNFYLQSTTPELLSPNLSPNDRPNRIRRAPATTGPPLLIIEKDITVNDQGQIVEFNPMNITNTLVYSFQDEYSAGIFFDTLYLKPILLRDANDENDVTGSIVYNMTVKF